jgi:predicted histone-like DNA-binding protein
MILNIKIKKKIMALHIKLIRNNIKSSNSYGKYFAKAVSQGEITLDEICEEISRNSSFSEGTVLGVVTELQDTMKEKLRDGQTVVLPGIGRFSLRVESIGVDNPKDFNIRRHITRIVCGFLPAGRRIQGRHILYDLCEGVKTIWHKGCKP